MKIVIEAKRTLWTSYHQLPQHTYMFKDICPIVSLEQYSYLSEEYVYTISPEDESETD